MPPASPSSSVIRLIMNPLSSLPEPGPSRLAVRVTAAAQRHIRSGHPWVFDRSIESVSHAGSPGDLAVIFDKKREFLAIGLYDPASPIRIRVLHSGKPLSIDNDFWLSGLVAALDKRAALEADDATTAYRLVNGESDGFGGLVLDLYNDIAVLKVYTPAWIPHLAAIVGIVGELLEPTAVVLRLSRSLQAGEAHGLMDGMTIAGKAPTGPVLFRENGLRFEVDPVVGQKTGYFLDQRDNRAMLGGLSERARVLDVFSYTGGFSVHAAAGGAAEVVSVDQAKQALSAAEANMAHNADNVAVRECRHVTMSGDAFLVLRDLATRGERFDVVALDPPSFAQRQSNVDGALHSYRNLAAAAVRVLNDGGWLMAASCSSRVSSADFLAAVDTGASSAGAELRDSIVTGHGVDHPVTFPEGQYLKAVFARAVLI